MPTKYVHFTDEQKEQARQTDLCELLRSQGETLKRSGTEYEWKDGSQKVTIRGNLSEYGSVRIILINEQEIRKEQTDHASSSPSSAT